MADRQARQERGEMVGYVLEYLCEEGYDEAVAALLAEMGASRRLFAQTVEHKITVGFLRQRTAMWREDPGATGTAGWWEEIAAALESLNEMATIPPPAVPDTTPSVNVLARAHAALAKLRDTVATTTSAVGNLRSIVVQMLPADVQGSGVEAVRERLLAAAAYGKEEDRERALTAIGREWPAVSVLSAIDLRAQAIGARLGSSLLARIGRDIATGVYCPQPPIGICSPPPPSAPAPALAQTPTSVLAP
jgi:hypothetical protein